MAGKTANVNVRVEQDVKVQAEAILEQLGISVSTFINMTYRQVIMKRGIPFDISLPTEIMTRDSLSDAEFDVLMATGLSQAKVGDSIPDKKAFDSLLEGL